MVHYKIYNLDVNLSLDDFCADIKVPQWGSHREDKRATKGIDGFVQGYMSGKKLFRGKG